MTLATFGLVALLGATLGFRFNVRVLFSAIGLAVFYVACIEVPRGDGGGRALLTMTLTAVALQIGYLIAITLRSFARTFIDICRARIFWPGPTGHQQSQRPGQPRQGIKPITPP